MKCRLIAPFRLVLFIISILILGSGCATTGPAPAPSAVVISKIESREADGKIEVLIQGNEPILQYTSFQLTEPNRLVIDISDASLTVSQKVTVGKGLVLDVVPTQMDSIARLEIGLTQAADTRLYQSGAMLIAEFSPSSATEPQSETPAPVPVADQEPAAPQPESAKGTATIVKSVQATAGKDGVKVVISANGTMVPSTFMVEGKKLVIDIPGTKSKVRPSVIPVRKGGLDKVRIGQHTKPEQKVRVVLDLTQQMAYEAEPKGNTLLIAMKPEDAGKSAEPPEPRERSGAVQAPSPAAETESAIVPEKTVAAEKPVEAQPEAGMKGVAAALKSSSPLIGGGKYSGRRISLDLQDADLVNVLRLFGDVANLNMIIAPGVKGRVTVRMINIPWDQAMDIILKMNGLGYALDENILRIASIGALTKEAEQEARAKESKKKAEDLVTRVVGINYAKAGDINGTLKKSLSSRGETVVDDRTNTIIIKDIARNVDEVLTLIKLLDKQIPQVMIEARIVEATTSFTRDIGVQWGGSATADASHGNATGFTFPNSIGVTGGPTMGSTTSGSGNYFVNLPAGAGSGAGGAIGFTFGSLTKALNLDLILSAMESTGEGKVVSSPRVSALDNKEAKIQQGQSIPYSTTSAGGTAVQFIQANLELAVTPHVTPDNKIFMKVKATKNAPDTSLLGAGGQPSIRSNEATTEILLADGETAVIGGILILDRGETIQKVPFFADLPLIGWLFKKKTNRDDKRELLIFITPKIIKQEMV